jgi:hypothetical protein
MRPEITVNSIDNLTHKVIKTIFEGIATDVHYKALYKVQKDNNLNLLAATRLFFKNTDFLKLVEDYLKDDKNYKDIFRQAIQNFENGINGARFFSEEDIPLRNCDFKVEEVGACSWFYIEERVEINYSGSRFYISRLIVDPKSNIIVYSSGDGNWETYSEDGPVGLAYKSFLADEELLK